LMLGRTTERVIAPGSMVIGNRTTGPGELSSYPSGTNADLYMEGLGTTSGINFAAYPSFNGKSGLVMSSFNGVTHEEVINYTGGTTVINTNLDVIGRIQFEPISVGMATVFPVCQFTSPNHSVLSNCPSSSIRYKTNVADLSRGLDVLRRLRPVTFNWKESGDADFGLIAEEVAEVDPFLVYHNKKGEVEGVKYDRIGVFLINVVKEQQKQLDEQAGTIKRQQSELDALKQLVCMSNRDAAICR
ncbi:MAG: tail fiber domain-containing protein, partial [Pyrinomonadaceae bacterium]